MAPTQAANHLNPPYHAPSVFLNNHGAEVDLWGVGKLILDAREFVPCLPAEMLAVGETLVAGQTILASEVLNEIRS
jgi:hypothetical protein